MAVGISVNKEYYCALDKIPRPLFGYFLVSRIIHSSIPQPGLVQATLFKITASSQYIYNEVNLKHFALNILIISIDHKCGKFTRKNYDKYQKFYL